MTPEVEDQIRAGCCAASPKPCARHEGWIDGWEEGYDDGFDAGYRAAKQP